MDRKFYQKYFYPLCLAVFPILCTLLILPKNSIFGSEGDWFSQHLAIAEQFRSIFYETGQILPDFTLAGSGSNIYDFSYYGLLRPDVLISFLLPQVPMAWILSIYAVLEIMGGSILCYCWLKKHVSIPFFAFIGGVLYSCATCFYQAHHQVMFVNYLPFLLLALLGVDRMLAKEKHGLLVLSLVLVYLHSYYFAPSVLAAVFLYFLFCLFSKQGQSQEDGKIRYWVRLFFSIGISIGIAAVLLLPTGLDLLSTKKDAGIPPSLSEICSVQLSMESLLYHPGGCGLSLICLYTLLLGIRRKSTRALSILLLTCLMWNACPYLLSGLLYIRYKVLIPLIPFLLLLCTRALELLYTGKERHSLLCGLLCLVPAYFFEMPAAVLTDAALTAAIFAIAALLGKLPFTSSVIWKKQFQLPAYLLLCIPPAIALITVSSNDQFISASDARQAVFSTKELEALNMDKSYRFDCLTEPYANVNVLPLQGMGSTTMYSSVTDKSYADFYYNVCKNPIRVRNRVALMTDANPFFAYLMGIRYIQAKDSALPWGYTPILTKGHTVIAENSNTLPIAYTSSSLMGQDEFDKLSFPYTLEALVNYTIADPSQLGNENEGATAKDFMERTKISPVSLGQLTGQGLGSLFQGSGAVSWQQGNEGEALTVSLKKEQRVSIPLASPLDSKLLICSFHVESPKGKEVTIDINGIRNKLSSRHAAYPNQNHEFTYIISSAEEIKTLDITLKPGEYLLSELKFWTMDVKQWGNQTVSPAIFSETAGNPLFEGTASCGEGGFFVTSYPFRKGYTVWVDGEKTPVLSVNQGFVGFPLTAGSHKVTITYRPPGKTAAIAVSIASLALLFSAMFLENRIRAAAKKNSRNLNKGSQHK